MKKVMVRAWEIAREGQAKFGGKVSEYFAQALKMAWVEVKQPQTVEVKTTYGSRKNKSWVAQIVGKCSRFGFERNFVKSSGEHTDGFGGYVYKLTDGVYEICNSGDRYFVKVSNGEMFYIDREDIAVA